MPKSNVKAIVPRNGPNATNTQTSELTNNNRNSNDIQDGITIKITNSYYYNKTSEEGLHRKRQTQTNSNPTTQKRKRPDIQPNTYRTKLRKTEQTPNKTQVLLEVRTEQDNYQSTKRKRPRETNNKFRTKIKKIETTKRLNGFIILNANRPTAVKQHGNKDEDQDTQHDKPSTPKCQSVHGTDNTTKTKTLITSYLKPTNKSPFTAIIKPKTETKTLITTYFKPTKNNTGSTNRTQQRANPTAEMKLNMRLKKTSGDEPIQIHKTQAPVTEDNNNKHTETHKQLVQISMLYTNQNRKKAALTTLSGNIINNQAPIIFICEPYCNSNFRIPNIHKDIRIIKPEETKERPRVAMGIHKNHCKKAITLHEFSSRDSIAIQINEKKQKIVMATIYMAGKKEEKNISQYTNIIHRLAIHAKKQKAALIINSDTNSHSTIWGDKITDQRGDDIQIAIAQNELYIINQGNKPTFENSRLQQSIIDLTITNKLGSELIDNWRVSNEFTNTDHKYIRAKLNLMTHKYTKTKSDKNTNWEKFTKILEEDKELGKIHNNPPKNKTEMDKASEIISNSLTKAWDLSTEYTYSTNKIKPPPWYNRDIKTQILKTKTKLKRHRKYKTTETSNELREANNTLNRLQRHYKLEAWKNFTEDIESTPAIARINKICKNRESTTRSLEGIRRLDGTITTNAVETLEIMRDSHFGTTTESKINQIQTADREKTLEFGLDEVKEAINSMKPNKAPGPDKITANMLQHALDQVAIPLQQIFQCSYNIGQTPTNWKTSTGIFLPKPGKTDYNNPKSYRTITLAPVILKIQERLIYWNLEKGNIDSQLDKRQFGFRKSSSTEAALHNIVHKIEKRIKKSQYALGVFLDVEGAFDKISFEAIQRGLINKGIETKTINWIMDMTTTRSLKIEHKGEHITFRIKRGVAQGGILSPLIWNIVLDSLLQSTAKDAPAYIQAFADDLISLAEGEYVEIIRERTQKTLNHINRWCKEQGLSLSAVKTTMIMFTKNTKWELKPIYIEGTEIKLSESAKFLGVTLDNKLKFNIHVDNITKQARINLLRTNIAIGSTWGLSPQVALWIYRQTIRPLITYAAPYG